MIFVTGISSSGKSHTVARAVEAAPGFVHVKASELLRECGQPIRPLTRQQAMDNQAVLIEALRSHHFIGRTDILLDGHATIETDDGPMPVPEQIFDALSPSLIVHVEEKLARIVERRKRRHLPWSRAEAQAYQNMERECSLTQAERLGIPFVTISSGDIQCLLSAIGRLVKK